MKIFKILPVVFISLMLFTFNSCGNNSLSIEQVGPRNNVQLWELLDETPVLASLFENVDLTEFNNLTNDLILKDPDAIVEILRRTADTFYGDNVSMPLAMSELSDGFISFYDTYKNRTDDFDKVIDITNDIMNMDETVMDSSIDALLSTLDALKKTPLFDAGQEMEDFDIDNLIRNLKLGKKIFQSKTVYEMISSVKDDAENDPEYATVEESLHAKVIDMISFIENKGDSDHFVSDLFDFEKEIADWMRPGYKGDITTYLLEQLYPMVKNPVLENATGEKNIMIRGKQLLDEQARILSKKLSDGTLFTKLLVKAFYDDIEKWDDLENVDIFSQNGRNGRTEDGLLDTNELLKWLRDNVLVKTNKALTDVTPEVIQDILWNGQNGKLGIIYNAVPGSTTVQAGDGYVTLMSKEKSTSTVDKPFRTSIASELSEFYDTGDTGMLPHSYNGEPIIEAIMTNLKLYVLSRYFGKDGDGHWRWALTPEDGTDIFNDSNRNLQTLFGGLVTATRNLVMLDAEGTKNSVRSGLYDMVFLLDAASGNVDPTNAPTELSLKNCLKSMGSKLWNKSVIAVDSEMMGIKIHVDLQALGNNCIKRRADGESEVTYATQHDMSAIEILQPGTFVKRENDTAPTTLEWHGNFAASQGDIRGIVDSNGKINTSTWSMSEIALNCWEGYGPYTYKGKAPNGSDCKYKNYFNSDWYKIEHQVSMDNTTNYDHGPGMSNGEGRYRVYEAIYRPSSSEVDSNPDLDSGHTDRNGDKIPKYGFMRPNGAYAAYTGMNKSDVSASNAVQLDCNSREEAIRKNFYWLLNQKKYQFLIPMQAGLSDGVDAKLPWYLLFGATIHVPIKMELYTYSTINANGIMGVAKAKRSTTHGNIQDNATWGLSGINSNHHTTIDGGDAYVLTTESLGSNTYAMENVSFGDGDYCVAIDYHYITAIESNGGFGDDIMAWIINTLGLKDALINGAMSVSDEVWGCLGDESVLPTLIGTNFTILKSIAGKEYSVADVVGTNVATASDMSKFEPFITEYYPGIDISSLKANKFPPIPKVNGVSYPTTFDAEGNATTWEEWTGSSKGKYEDIVGLLGLLVGTMHEDGQIIAKNGSVITDPAQIDDGDVQYYARDGFRQHIDNLIQTLTALNENSTLYDSTTYAPKYNATLVNKLIDGDVAGDKLGPLPELLTSKYLNINNIDPVKEQIENVTKDVIRSYFNNFELTKGATDGSDLDVYSTTPADPDDFWAIPINRLRYFTDDNSLDQAKRVMDFVKDLSTDDRFVEFFKATVPALNKYMVVKYMDENDVTQTVAEQNAFSVSLNDADIDNFISFIQDLDYEEILNFVKDSGLNDIEKFYNFSLDDWVNALSQTELQPVLDELNAKVAKYFGYSIKEAIIDGIYKNKDTGKTYYGLGEYRDDDGDGTFTYYPFDGTDGEPDITDATQFDVTFKGIRDYFDLKDDPADPTDFAEYCLEYQDPWYQGGNAQCPNIYSLHNYDLKMHEAMNAYNDWFLDLSANDFKIGYNPASDNFDDVFTTYDFGKDKNLDGKGDISYYQPKSLLNFLYGFRYDGTNYTDPHTASLDLKYLLDFTKDFAMNEVYKQEVTVPNPNENEQYSDTNGNGNWDTGEPFVDTNGNGVCDVQFEDYTTNIRQIVSDYRELMYDRVFHYDGESTYEIVEAVGTHKHIINTSLDIMATILNPDSEEYKTQMLYDAWYNFIDEAKIEPEKLIAVRNTLADLLWNTSANSGAGDYTMILSKMASKFPPLLRSFDGFYATSLDFALNALEPGAIGDYMASVMELPSQYDAWDVVNDFKKLLDQDIFKNYDSEDTFWWQFGNLSDDMAQVIEDQVVPRERDYSGAVLDIFRK